jgi:uncharacterized coiled-coil protein SlyX
MKARSNNGDEAMQNRDKHRAVTIEGKNRGTTQRIAWLQAFVVCAGLFFQPALAEKPDKTPNEALSRLQANYQFPQNLAGEHATTVLLEQVKEEPGKTDWPMPMLDGFNGFLGSKNTEAIDSIGSCGLWNHDATYGMSITLGLLGNVLAAVSWACEETVGGFNGALACAVPNGAYQAFASLVEVGSFCNESNEHDDQLEVFNKTHAIGQYVGDKLDDELASRATVEQGQQAEDKTGAIQSTLDDYFPVYFPLIEQRQAEQADQVNQQDQQLTDIQTRLADLQDQQRLLLARLQDINQRAADIQQENTETRDDTQSIRQGLQAAQGQVQGLDMNLDARVLDNRQLFLAMQLVDLTTGRDINNALPLFQGGRLERVREMVNHALAMAQAAGFDVTAAQARFAQGDTAYNQQQYNTAYHHYAAAYQLITGPELPGGGF